MRGKHKTRTLLLWPSGLALQVCNACKWDSGVETIWNDAEKAGEEHERKGNG